MPHPATMPLLPMKAHKKELRYLKHVMEELTVACWVKDICPFPFGLGPAIFWEERVSDGITKAIERTNAVVEFVWERNSRTDELQWL